MTPTPHKTPRDDSSRDLLGHQMPFRAAGPRPAVGAKAGLLVPLVNAALWLGVTLLGATAALILLAVRHARPSGTEGVVVGPRTAARALTCPQPPSTSLPTVATTVADVEPETAEVSS